MALTLNYYTDDTARTTANMNAPLEQLAAAIDGLTGTVTGLSTTGCLKVVDVAFAAGVQQGMAVYLNAGVATPALARWSTSYGPQGEPLPAVSSKVIGIVSEVRGSVADIVVAGNITDAATIIATCGVNPSAGDYYLSQDVAGTLVTAATPAARPYLPIVVATVISPAHMVLRIEIPSTGYHIHRVYDVPVDGGSWAAQTVGDYAFVYTGTELADLSYFNDTEGVIVVDGVVDYQANFFLDRENDAVVLRAKTSPVGGVTSLMVYTSFPHTKDLPVVRAVNVSGTSRLSARATNGVVTLSFDPATAVDSAVEYSPTALARLESDGGSVLTPVVSKITAGGNLTAVTNGSTGEVVLVGGYQSSTPVQASLLDMNGCSLTSQNGVLYYYFPAAGTVSVLAMVPIVAPPAGITYELRPFVMFAGVAGGYTGNITASVKFQRLQSTSVGVDALGSSAITASVANAESIMGVGSTPLYSSYGGVAYVTFTRGAATAQYVQVCGLLVTPVSA